MSEQPGGVFVERAPTWLALLAPRKRGRDNLT
jgi:hypothetical protein